MLELIRNDIKSEREGFGPINFHLKFRSCFETIQNINEN